MLSKQFDFLIDQLKEIPGINTKHASQILKFLIKQNLDNDHFEENLELFKKTIMKVRECKICGNFIFDNQCEICLDKDRESVLMIIENVEQLLKYEQHKIFKGKYFKIPILFNKKFEKVNTNYDFDQLLNYAKNFKEIIIAISPTAEGIMTSNEIIDIIEKSLPKIKTSQLAIGIPLGSSIDYMDHLTMSYAIKNRKEVK